MLNTVQFLLDGETSRIRGLSDIIYISDNTKQFGIMKRYTHVIISKACFELLGEKCVDECIKPIITKDGTFRIM